VTCGYGHLDPWSQWTVADNGKRRTAVRAVRGIGASALLVGLMGGLLAGAGPASASVDPGVWNNGAYDGLCLDVAASGQPFLGGCDGLRTSQRWTSPPLSGEPGSAGAVFGMRNDAAGRCLTAAADGGVTTAACTFGDSQAWVGGSLLVNQATGLCLAAESPTDLRQVPCDPDYLQDDQRWYPSQAGT
jgi:hypothetical protein